MLACWGCPAMPMPSTTGTHRSHSKGWASWDPTSVEKFQHRSHLRPSAALTATVTSPTPSSSETLVNAPVASSADPTTSTCDTRNTYLSSSTPLPPSAEEESWPSVSARPASATWRTTLASVLAPMSFSFLASSRARFTAPRRARSWAHSTCCSLWSAPHSCGVAGHPAWNTDSVGLVGRACQASSAVWGRMGARRASKVPFTASRTVWQDLRWKLSLLWMYSRSLEMSR
mmetsp:Transcript_5466/g.15414  ORF Transcript_5466/g.15414 Transcript_5466/m.15414 type:complete len:230 (-) Transcript_5466:1104-1793(-)